MVMIMNSFLPRLMSLLLLVLLALPVQAATEAKASGAKEGVAKVAAPAVAPAPANIVLPVIDLQGLLPAGEAEATETPPEPSFGAHLLDWLSENGSHVGGAFGKNLDNVADLPQLSKWWDQQMSQPRLIERWQLLGAYGGQIVLWGVGGAVVLHFLLASLRRRLRPEQTYSLARRLGLGLVQFALGLLPIVVLVLVAMAVLADAPDLQVRGRLVLQNGVYTLVSARLLLLLGKLFLSPQREHLRLLPLSHEHARRLYRWVRAVTVLALVGGWLLDAARTMDVPEDSRRAFAHLLGLVLLVGLVTLVRMNRAVVAGWLRGDANEQAGDLLGWARYKLSAHWHRLTIGYLLIGYTVTILSPSGAGFSALLQGTFITVLVFMVMNILLYGLDILAQQAEAARVRQERLPLHQPVLRGLLRLLISAGGVYLILLGWNVDFSAWMQTELALRLTGASLSISIAVVVAVLSYEVLCSLLSQGRRPVEGVVDPHFLDRAARMQTLLPLIRHSAAVVLTVAVLLIGLSELGVNIAPLLAGAGIVGVAIGFGSQALVKDFITGLFIIIEDTIHVGDVVICGAHKGTVESMTIRTLRLRDVQGALHVLPYSEVTGFINQTRGFAFAVMDIGVAYDTDLRKAFTVLAEIGTALQQDPELGQNILAPIEVNGIQNFADSAIILRARIKTLPGQQWKVRYAYMLALKERFDAEKIVIPFPTVTHQFSADVPLQATAFATLPPRHDATTTS